MTDSEKQMWKEYFENALVETEEETVTNRDTKVERKKDTE